MHSLRYELIGFEASELKHLKAFGMMSETIAFRTRLFIPTGADGPHILKRVMAKYQPSNANAA